MYQGEAIRVNQSTETSLYHEYFHVFWLPIWIFRKFTSPEYQVTHRVSKASRKLVSSDTIMSINCLNLRY